jgi:prepilin-type N-terminal cleavage/methylation domain-containing protein
MNVERGLHRGFTLIEILVVLLIASIVMAILVSVLGSSFEILRAGETRAQLNSNARTALDYVCNDLTSASYIPLATDRDLNGYADETPDPAFGYDTAAIWRVAFLSNNVPVVAASYFLSEAWSDRLMTAHTSVTMVSGQSIRNQNFSIPRTLVSGGSSRVAEYTSFFRLSLPANSAMPYYLLPPRHTMNGAVTPSGQITGYPDVIPAGPHKETAALVEDFFYKYEGESEPRRVRLIPISSNITRVKFEYLQEVPVYLSQVNGGQVQVAYQDTVNGDIQFEDEFWEGSSIVQSTVPLIDHWELRPVDVAYDVDWTDGVTGALYGGNHWLLADQYPEGVNTGKLNGAQAGTTGVGGGLGYLAGGSLGGWSCSAFYNTSSAGSGGASDNAPVDRFAYVTRALSGAQQVSGGMAGVRADMGMLHGQTYLDYSEDPTGIGDFGDADGIPDGDGVPDDPVPGWWLPYVRAVRVTIVATPQQVIAERRVKSGKAGKGGTRVYYRLDSPVPYFDPDRLIPLYNQRQDYIGAGRDVVLTKTVPVDFAYRSDVVTDPRSALIDQYSLRRAEINYALGGSKMFRDPLTPEDMIRAVTPSGKYYERTP